ncbi:MAG: dipeptidase PepE, partial [Mariniblastus sp.]|nr:dipeptidase PepE [Mariniblastus sp.]
MARLLLLSSSRVHPTGFLEHCRDRIAEHFSGCQELTFIPYALADHEKYESVVQEALEPLGIQVRSIHHAADPILAIESAQAIFTGGGNTFRLLKTLYDQQLIDPLRTRVQQAHIPYMGSSAGTNLAGPTIRTTNDMPIVEPPSFQALHLVPFQINPHYLDANPNS